MLGPCSNKPDHPLDPRYKLAVRKVVQAAFRSPLAHTTYLLDKIYVEVSEFGYNNKYCFGK